MKGRDSRARSRRDLTRSDPDFDRSNIADADYIELLLFEIKELKSALVRKDQLIQSLQGNLTLGKEDDIPRRSAKRNPTEKDTAADDELDKNLESLKTELDSLKSNGVESLSSLQKHRERGAPPLPQMPAEYQRRDGKDSGEVSVQKPSDVSPPDAIREAQQKIYDIKEEQDRIRQQQSNLEREQKRIELEKLARENTQKSDQEQLLREKTEKEREEKERLRAEQEKLEQERLQTEKAEQERLEKERVEEERLQQERAERERLKQEKLGQERLEKERLEQERLEQERLKNDRLEQERLEHEKVPQEEAAKKETIRQEQEKLERQRLEAKKLNRSKADSERIQRETQKFDHPTPDHRTELLCSPHYASSKSLENDITDVSQTSVLSASTAVGMQAKNTANDLESNRSSVYSQEETQPTQQTKLQSPNITTTAQSFIPGESYASTDHGDETTLDSGYDASDVTSQDYSISNNLKPTRSSENSSFTQHKNQSTGSFQSYKSRIKLPQNLQQHQLHAGSTDVTLTPTKSPYSAHSAKTPLPHSKGSRDLNLKELSLDIPLQHSRDQTSALRSPAVLTTFSEPPSARSPSFNSKISTPTLQDDPYKRAPNTPEEFYNSGGISNFLSNDLAKLNTYGSNVSSPVNTVQYSPATNQSSGFDNDNYKTPHHNVYSQDSLYPNKNGSTKFAGSSSSFSVLRHTPADEQDIPLFVKPEDFHTIKILVVSTLSQGNTHGQSAAGLKRLDDVLITLLICDDSTGKEIWRIRKSYNQIVGFDNEIRPTVEYFGLPVLPDKSLFLSTAPSKIDLRRSALQNYFNTLFVMPHIPHLILFRICKYLSLDVVNPLDDFKSGARKEGYLLRRYKSLGTSWKVRWCQVEGPVLEIYDAPGGSLIEQISLINCQIGRQSNDSVAEDKGYRHAFLIMESGKMSKISGSVPKHFFCAETDEERDDWVAILIDLNQSATNSTTASEVEDNETVTPGRNQGDYLDDLDSYISSKGSKAYPEQEELKEKKNKKRGIFAFRNKSSTTQNSSLVLEGAGAMDDVGSLATPTPDPTMQEYLDRMNLDADVSTMIFGKELLHVYKISHHPFLGREVPSICYRCIDFLLKSGAIYEQGIFRLSGSASTIRLLKEAFNVQHDVDLFASALKPDINTVAGLLKTFLREMPSPIIGGRAHSDLRQILNARGAEAAKSTTGYIFRDYFNDLKNIDQIHYDLTFIVLKFLKEIINNNKTNKMNLRNVCIVFVPTLNISLDVLSTLLIDFGCIFENSEPTPDDQREVLDLNIPTF